MNDLISRQAAIEKIHWLGLDNDTAIKCDLAIRALPSVNPQPKQRTGRWYCSDDMYESAICSICKFDTGDGYDYIKQNFKYCPNCGAKMIEPQESEGKDGNI